MDMWEKKDIGYYTYYVGEGREGYVGKKELEWNVYSENNNDGIVVHNIFEHNYFLNRIIDANKKYVDDFEFLKEVRASLMYLYWSKSEYEIILTSWPPRINKNELNRLMEVDFKYTESVNLTIEKKIDIYNQVMINWEAFKLYLLTNRGIIPKKKR